MVRRLLILTVTFVLATGAVVTSAPAQTDGGADEGSDLAEPTVEVLEPGDEPRLPLRYALTAGTTINATQTLDQYLRQVDDEGFGSSNRSPTIDLGSTINVVDVLPDGTSRVGFAFTSVDATGIGSARSADEARAIESALFDLTELTGETTMTNRGVVLSGGYDIPDDFDETLTTLVEQYESQLQSVSPPLPEDPVGVGARWRATTELELGGITAQQTYDYTVESVNGTQVELRVKIRQTAEPQDFDPPGAARDDEYRLLSLELRGKGDMTLDLAAPLPLEASIEARSVQKMRIKERGEDAQVETITIEQEQRLSTS